MPVRNFVKDDVEEVVAIINSRCRPKGRYFAEITEDIFNQKVLSCPYFKQEGFFVYERSGRIIGFALCTYRPKSESQIAIYAKSAFLPLFYLSPRLRKRDVAVALLDHVEKYVKECGKDEIWTHYIAPCSIYLGIYRNHRHLAEALMEHGFEVNQDYPEEGYFHNNLKRYRIPWDVEKAIEKLKDEGVNFSVVDTDKRIADLLFVNGKYGWYDSFKRKPKREGRKYLIAEQDGSLIAYCGFSTRPFRGIPLEGGGWGPILVDKKHRRRGIGTALVALSLDYMKRLGLTDAYLSTGAFNHYSYRRLGFRLIAAFKIMRKKIS